MRRRKARQERVKTERGAVLIELAIVAPFLMLLVLGVMEVGLRTHSSQTIDAATRSATRAASSAGDDRLADFTALQSLAGGLGRYDAADIERIIIFNASAADGAMPAGCDLGPVSGECNHYLPASLGFADTAFTSAGTSCAPSAPDASWCPLDRESDQVVGADWLGVEVWIRHQSFAPFLRDTTLKESTVMRLEPRFAP